MLNACRKILLPSCILDLILGRLILASHVKYYRYIKSQKLSLNDFLSTQIGV